MTTGIPVREIAEVVKGRVEGDDTVLIDGAAGLTEATNRHISFFHNAKYADQLAKTHAGAILLAEKTNGLPLPSGKTLIRVSHPQLAFAQVLALLDKRRQRHPAPGISKQAAVDPSAQIGENAAIGPFVVVEKGARIGNGAILYAGVYIGQNARVGDNALVYPQVVLREDTEVGARVIIHAGAVLGADGYGFATTAEGRHEKIPQIGKVVVEDDVEIGANVTIDRGTTGETRIGQGTKIDNLVHIAHNVQIGKNCLIVAQVGISGSTKVGNQVTLAGQVGIIGHLTIGDGATIAAQSGIMNDVEPGAVLFGTPARPHREAMKLQALYGKLPELYDALKALKKKFLS